VVRGHCQEAKRGEAGGQRIPRNCEVLGTFLRTCATTELSLIAMWRLIGATPRGQPWTPAVTLPQGRDGLSARRMAVLWTFRAPSLCRHVPHELMRNAALNLTLIIPTTACHQRNYVERYSRYRATDKYLSLSRLNHRLPRGQTHPEIMQGTACRHIRLVLHAVRLMCATLHPCRDGCYSARETPCAIDS
jgi:hypothetical protein